MPEERASATTMRGRPLTLLGPEVRVGQPAPLARVLTQDLSEVSLGNTGGETQILLTIPSVDTPVCSAETKRFNEEAARLPGIAVKVVSVDLPFALKRWCGSEGVENLQLLSDHRAAEFGERYGTLIKELRLLSRAAFVVDRDNQVVYAEYVPEIANHPDYEAILTAARRAAAP
jgi:thioredoxin-dependent peroxiredoxin